MGRSHIERHGVARIGWLRAAVLGANDGIVSTASLIVGVAAAAQTPREVLIVGLAGLVAGAMSMAAGEYVSVSSQADTERADLGREAEELKTRPRYELEELTGLYVARGLQPALARKVAEQLTAHNALAAHSRDELGVSEVVNAKPVQAALTSALTFATGAALPLAVAAVVPSGAVAALVSVAALVCLAILGGIGAWLGGAPIWRAVLRVTFWGAIAMSITAGVGALFGVRA